MILSILLHLKSYTFLTYKFIQELLLDFEKVDPSTQNNCILKQKKNAIFFEGIVFPDSLCLSPQ